MRRWCESREGGRWGRQKGKGKSAVEGGRGGKGGKGKSVGWVGFREGGRGGRGAYRTSSVLNSNDMLKKNKQIKPQG